jgi:FlaA1/EpsC-like NDP-sugar epimerase
MISRIRQSIANALRAAKRRRAAARAAPIDLSDLLGREAVNLDTPELQRFLAGKVILVTGAGGSIGSEICRQSMKFCPARLVLLDRAENALFEIDRELNHRWVGADVVPVVADICDAPRIAQIFETHRPHVVFHAAAHKHVPMMELNPGEAIKNNVFGTKTVADAALASGAGAFVMVSTDKAVNPSSVMGATKRVAELYVQSLNARSTGVSPVPSRKNGRDARATTRFLAVRFGNVLGSSGSVVPIFQKQIDAGGPVTITHPDMQRYFMLIPEASQLVMQAGAIGQGGEIFVLDMGEPVKILDLALELVRRRGLEPGRDIDIEFTGIRPGEKLFEELAADDEQTRPTAHPMIRVWELPKASGQQMKRMLELLGQAASGSRDQILYALSRCVPEYRPDTATSESPDQATNLRLIVAASDATAEAA